ncbi:MAG: hypothetical protein AAB558_01465 [Patescibacteria group bacterium]
MNRRLAIIIGVALIVIGLGALGYFGYVIFGGSTGDANTEISRFYLKQSQSVENPTGQHMVVVTGVLSPEEGTPADWSCAVRAWDWGDGTVIRDEGCSALYNDSVVEFPSGYTYTESGTYTVKLYAQLAGGTIYASDELEVVAP